MTDPRIPHLLGVTLDTTGVAQTLVVAMNRNNGEKLIKPTDANKVAVFDAADFTTLYAANDVIEFQNVGSSVGVNTITINSAAGGFQEVTITCAAAPTVSISL